MAKYKNILRHPQRMPFVFQIYFSVILMASKRKMEDNIMIKEKICRRTQKQASGIYAGQI